MSMQEGMDAMGEYFAFYRKKKETSEEDECVSCDYDDAGNSISCDFEDVAETEVTETTDY